MRSILTFGAVAIALALASSAAAQSNGAAEPPAASSTAAQGASAAGALSVGLPVKDKTGAAIGQITQVKNSADGKAVATIKMGADSFAVDASTLEVENGTATINASQAEIKAMMKK